MYDIDITDCIKNLCKLLADTSLSSGEPKKIYDGLFEVPDISELTDLPIAIVDITGPLKFDENYSAQKYGVTFPLEVWYVTTNDTDESITDILREDGAILAKILHNENLSDTIERLEVLSIDCSNYNAINMVAMDEESNILAVCVALEASFNISKRDLDG